MAAERQLEAPVLVGAPSGKDVTTVRERLIPVASIQVDDVRFEFDSSFVLPDAAADFGAVDLIHRSNPDAPLGIFGHADPVGDDEYNKVLSGRRALAIFAVLTRRTDIWERLHAKPHGRDDWGAGVFGTMRQALNVVDGATGVPKSAGERAAIFSAYMDLLCRDVAGRPFQLSATRDFLARGVDKDAKGDVQGCGEFNPDLILPLGTPGPNAAGRNEARDEANAPNRRVVILFFTPDARVDPKDWPCPRALEGTAACRKRLWSDAARRRAPAAELRDQRKTGDTYSCRFYDRIAPPPDPRGLGRLLRALGLANFSAVPVTPVPGQTDPHPVSNSEVFDVDQSPRVQPLPES
jgi:OmpA family protein